MKRFKDKRKVVSLTLVGIAYALIITPLIIHNLNQQQDLRGRSQTIDPNATSELANISTTQTSLAQCTAAGFAEVGVAYTNPDKDRTVSVTATDTNTGQTINLGEVGPGQTNTGSIALGKNSVSNGTVRFTVTYIDTNEQQQTSASYTGKTCTKAISQLNQTFADVPNSCGNVTTDIVLIIDRSGSMGQANKLVQAKNAAKNFIDVVAGQESTTRVSLVSFSTTSKLDAGLSTDYNKVKSEIDGLKADGWTCQECAVKEANKEIKDKGRQGVKKVVVVLADGQANYLVGGRREVEPEVGEKAALDAVKEGFAESNTVFFTIGLGTTADSGDGRFYSPEYMRAVAELTGGNFYFPAPDELDGVYQEISQLIGKGLLGGVVFNDENLNGQFDTNEPRLSGWTVEAQSAAGTKSAVSNNDGVYTIGGLCDGTYQLKQASRSGWFQTLPEDPNGYQITIDKASQYNDKHFGNTDKARCSDDIDNDKNDFTDEEDSTCHTDGNPDNPDSYDPKKDGEHGGGGTCSDSRDNNGDDRIDGADPVCHTDNDPDNPDSYDPTLPEDSTTIGITVFLDGIGGRGDNTNPTDSSLSNKNPLHPTINADVQVINVQNQIVSSGAGTITYASGSGNYKGEIKMENGFGTGSYTVKVKAHTYLRKLVNGFQTITAGIKNEITAVSLVAGDVDNNNRINILDYNLLLDCYSDLDVAVNCALQDKQIDSDLNDDGSVDQIDYNLFLREIATQPGQ